MSHAVSRKKQGAEKAIRGESPDGSRKDTSGWLSTLLHFAARCKGRMAIAELMSIISVLLQLVPFYAIYRIIEAVIAAPAADLGGAVMLWALVAIGSHVVSRVSFGFSTINAHISAYTILAELREEVATKMMRASLGTAQSKSIGNLKNLVVDRIESIEVPLAHMIPELSANLLLAIGIAIWLIVIDWRVALSCLATLPIGLVVMALGMQGYYKMYDRYLALQDAVNTAMVEYIEGIHVVKAFNQTTGSYAKFADAVRSFKDFTLMWMRTSWVAQSLAMSVIPTTLLGVVPVGVALYLGGALTPAEFGLACILAFAIVTPVTYLGASFNEMNLLKYAIADAREFLDLPELAQPDGPAQVRGRSVHMENVRFSYSEEVEILHGISLEAPEGSVTALVGPSGSGKSTLARLIARHWDVCNGSVRIGDADVRDMTLDQLSSMVSFVSQDGFLIDGTLRENLRLGKPDAADEEIDAAAHAASCDEFVSRLPLGWDTPAGEAGHALSGGEKQRICIARAILKDAPIVVFDEATAFADPENEARIQQSVARLARGKTLIVIAHRLSTIASADRIYVIDAGEVAAVGTHEQLLAENGLYASMWRAHIGAAAWAASSHGAKGAGATARAVETARGGDAE